MDTPLGVFLLTRIFAKFILQGMHSNARFVSFKEYGLNFEHAAEITSKYYATLKQEQFQIMNPEKYINVLQGDLSHQN